MNNLLPVPATPTPTPAPAIDGEILPADDRSVFVVAKQSIFSIEHRTGYVRAGQSIGEIVMEFVDDRRRFWRFARATVDGWPVPREHWHHVRPKPGRRVEITMTVPQGGGGGKNILRLVLIIAVLAASFAIPAIPALAIPFLGTGVSLGAVIGAGVAPGGRLAVGSMAPPRRP